jgi:hypothetical protein
MPEDHRSSPSYRFLLDLNQLESMLSNTPISKLNPSREEPPEEIKGNGIPMTGIIPIVIPILTKMCVNMTPTTP